MRQILTQLVKGLGSRLGMQVVELLLLLGLESELELQAQFLSELGLEFEFRYLSEYLLGFQC